MKVLYFGTYEKDYPRNKIFIEGLKKNDVEVIEVNVSIKKNKEYKTNNFIAKNLVLGLKYLFSSIQLLIKGIKIKKFDLIIVGFPSFFDIFPAKIISFFSGKKLVLNPLVSTYNTLIEDRKVIKKNSFTAKLIYQIEKTGLKLSDKIILDTKTHAEYFIEKFKLDKKKFLVIPVGAEEKIFYPRKDRKKDGFFVGFYGTFIPLHGIKYIIKAAKLLEKENIIFEIIGKGQIYLEIKSLAKENSNIKFSKEVGLALLPEKISKFDVCLGIFGETKKASMVIPNKVFQCLAMKKPVITGESKAIKEVFIHKKNIFLCKMADEKSLTEAIIELKKNKALREKISSEGNTLFNEKFTTKKIGIKLKKELEKI